MQHPMGYRATHSDLPLAICLCEETPTASLSAQGLGGRLLSIQRDMVPRAAFRFHQQDEIFFHLV